ncbi:hypothetical protein BaRGS_00021918 [Batillaria attramentaria]|uniref:Glucosylceramidase n=1 Tax=Batillaria attramentaria TaxID=370345 RepID=A0ABD0KII9_9CAEN
MILQLREEFLLLFTDTANIPCMLKDLGDDNSVCVCNSTYCDTVPPLPKLPQGMVAVYTSSQAGDRLVLGNISFTNTSTGVIYELHRNKTRQSIIGFGGAFTDSAGINIASLPQAAQDKLIRSYFAPEGIEYNIGRVPMASCDFSTHQYSYDDVDGDLQLAHFALAPEDTKYKIPFIQKAKNVSQRGIKLFASPWSAPAWMKTNKNMTGNGTLIGQPGGPYYKAWANYFVRFLQEYQKHNVTFWGLTAQNEPTDGYIYKHYFQAMGFTPEQQRDFIKLDLGPALHNSSFGDVKLMILDDNRLLLPYWAEKVLSDPEAKKYVSGIGIHWYIDQFSPVIALDYTHEEYPDVFILATEATVKVVKIGVWAHAQSYANDILDDLNHWVTGWTDWNIALSTIGGPNWVHNLDNSPIFVNATSGEFYKQPMFYAMGHFSKFLPPGSIYLEMTASPAPAGVKAVAFRRPDAKIAAVFLNMDNSPVTVSVHDPDSGYINLLLPALSLKTLIWHSLSQFQLQHPITRTLECFVFARQLLRHPQDMHTVHVPYTSLLTLGKEIADYKLLPEWTLLNRFQLPRQYRPMHYFKAKREVTLAISCDNEPEGTKEVWTAVFLEFSLNSSMVYAAWQLVLVSCTLFIATETDGQSCVPRRFDSDSVVCVCNSTYCDDVPEVPSLTPGLAAIYTTSLAGDRYVLNTAKPAENTTLTFVLEVKRDKTRQSIIGFGGAFTDAAGINIASLPAEAQDKLIRAYFAPEGLEYNIGRIPIASCDFSTHPYSYDDTDGDLELAHFTLAPEDLKYKIPYLQQAMNLTGGKLRLFGSPWSAPAWMKTDKNMTGNGTLIGQPGGPYFKAWANYFVRFVQEYGKHNLTMWGLTTQNEPSDGEIYHFPFQAMGWTPELQRDFVKLDLGPALQKNKLQNIKLMIMDDQRLFLPYWPEVVLSDAAARQYVSGVAVHWYIDDFIPLNVLDFTHDKFPDIFIFGSEACNGDRPWQTEKVILGDWGRAEKYATDIINDLNHWVTGWTDWNIALDQQGGPNWVKNFVDSPIIVNAAKGEFYKQPMFYILGHFSKFLKPDSKYVGLSRSSTLVPDVLDVAFVRPDGTLVVVLLNTYQEAVKLSLYDPGVGYIDMNLPPKSIKTVLWRSK